TVETECLGALPSTLDLRNVYPDMLYLRPSDPIAVPTPLPEQSVSENNSFVTNYGKNVAKNVATRAYDLLEVTGMPWALASAIASAEESGKLQQVFYCQD